MPDPVQGLTRDASQWFGFVVARGGDLLRRSPCYDAAAGVAALEIAAVLTVFFCYATLYVYFVGDGLESHHEARRKERKRLRKKAEAEQ